MRLFSQHQRWLYGYLMALLGDANDADEVMQEVCVVMWQQHEKFELGSNFVSWLSVIAYHQVQKFWRDRKRRTIFLGSDVVEQLAEGVPEEYELLEARRRALAECIEQLRESDRQLVHCCYADRKTTARAAARQLGRPEGTVYKALNRIRRRLLDCINYRVSMEGLGP